MGSCSHSASTLHLHSPGLWTALPGTHPPHHPSLAMPSIQWRAAVDTRMDELVGQARQRHEQEVKVKEEAPPLPQAEAVGLKFV